MGLERYTDHADLSPFFVGLPQDMCQSPHWGYVFAGKLVFHTADATSDNTDGGLLRRAGPHAGIFPGTKLAEFSPTADFTYMEIVGKNMESMG